MTSDRDHNTSDLGSILNRMQSEGKTVPSPAPEEVPLGLRKRCHDGHINQIIKYMKWTGSFAEKEELVLRFTEQRTKITKEMLEVEAIEMIAFLKARNDSMNTMRRKIIYYAREMKWELGGKADMQRIEQWCLHKGKFHKTLNLHSHKELPQLVSQFEAVYLSYLKQFKRK